MSSPQFLFDVIKAIRNDPKRRKVVRDAMHRVDSLSLATQEGKATSEELAAEQAKIVSACGFNFGLLMPHFFPTYINGSPLNLVQRPFMFAMTSLTPGAIVTLMAGRQIGKCASGATVLKTNLGDVSMKDLFEMGV